MLVLVTVDESGNHSDFPMVGAVVPKERSCEGRGGGELLMTRSAFVKLLPAVCLAGGLFVLPIDPIFITTPSGASCMFRQTGEARNERATFLEGDNLEAGADQ